MCGRPSERITNKCVKSIMIHGNAFIFSHKVYSCSYHGYMYFLFCSSLTFSFIKKCLAYPETEKISRSSHSVFV